MVNNVAACGRYGDEELQYTPQPRKRQYCGQYVGKNNAQFSVTWYGCGMYRVSHSDGRTSVMNLTEVREFVASERLITY